MRYHFCRFFLDRHFLDHFRKDAFFVWRPFLEPLKTEVAKIGAYFTLFISPSLHITPQRAPILPQGQFRR